MESYAMGDRRLPHHVFPPKIIFADQLNKASGVLSYQVDLDDMAATKKRISRVRSERQVRNLRNILGREIPLDCRCGLQK